MYLSNMIVSCDGVTIACLLGVLFADHIRVIVLLCGQQSRGKYSTVSPRCGGRHALCDAYSLLMRCRRPIKGACCVVLCGDEMFRSVGSVFFHRVFHTTCCQRNFFDVATSGKKPLPDL